MDFKNDRTAKIHKILGSDLCEGSVFVNGKNWNFQMLGLNDTVLLITGFRVPLENVECLPAKDGTVTLTIDRIKIIQKIIIQTPTLRQHLEKNLAHLDHVASMH
jgi:hypothetical protein